MQKPQYELGLIGLGTMGRNLLMNMADHGFSVAGYDNDPSRVEQILNTEHNEKISGQSNLTDFIAILKKPRVIMLLVPAGRIVRSEERRVGKIYTGRRLRPGQQ